MSRFVSAGTDATDAAAPSERDEAWQQAQQKIDSTRQLKSTSSTTPSGQQEGGKSLYETLQANKAAKQEAFEESQRLKNQFRALDDDEAAFLQGVEAARLETARADARETAVRLEAFRRRRLELDAAAAVAEEVSTMEEEGVGSKERSSASRVGEAEVWRAAASRKRRRGEGRVGLLGGVVKVRRVSGSTGRAPAEEDNHGAGEAEASADGAALRNEGRSGKSTTLAATPEGPLVSESAGDGDAPAAAATAKSAERPTVDELGALESASASASERPAALGLVGYSSDEDD